MASREADVLVKASGVDVVGELLDPERSQAWYNGVVPGRRRAGLDRRAAIRQFAAHIEPQERGIAFLFTTRSTRTLTIPLPIHVSNATSRFLATAFPTGEARVEEFFVVRQIDSSSSPATAGTRRSCLEIFEITGIWAPGITTHITVPRSPY